MDDVFERVVRERERQLPGLDLRQVEHVVDQTEEMLAVGLQAFQHLAHLLGRFAIDVVEDEFGVAEDGVERRAQLVAHVGQELRFVLACDLKLPALLVDLGEEVCVLDRKHRLGGECLEQVDCVGGMHPGLCGAPLARRSRGRARAAEQRAGRESQRGQ